VAGLADDRTLKICAARIAYPKIYAMRQLTLIGFAVGLLAACEIPPEVKLEMSCSTICNCLADTLEVDECITECIDEGDLALIPEDCFECIQQHSTMCGTLESDCEPICELEDDPPPPPVPVDGGMI
jgi:hypothetical protein